MGQVSLRLVNVAWTYLDSLGFILHFFNHSWNTSRLICSFCEAVTRSLSVTSGALSSENVAVCDSSVVGRSPVNSRYNNGPRTLIHQH
jgi:hypothetical protein